MKKTVGLLFAVVLCASGAVYGAPVEDAVALYERGAYEAAAEVAAQAGGAENFAFAARALNAWAYLQTDNTVARKTAKRALKLADQATKQDPALIEGYLQGAISLAQRGARMAPVRAFLSGIAGKARNRLDHALALDPASVWALSSSAAWHLEVSRRAGEGRFGSDPVRGHQQFLAARAGDPANPVIAYETALRFIAYGRSEWREEALSALKIAAAAPVTGAFEAAIQSRAKEFQAAVDEGHNAERAFINAQP